MKTFSGLPAVQYRGEYLPFLDFVSSLNITSYMEVGVARGDTFHDIVSLMPIGSRALAVDYPMQSWGLENSNKYLNAAIADLREKGYIVNVIYGDSQSPEIIKQVRKHEMFDLCFIDGDHTYKGVKADYENYGLFAKYAAFHDIADHMKPNKRGELIEVPIFWQELKQRRKFREWVDIYERYPMGIGIVL
jgi:hypothetical protein